MLFGLTNSLHSVSPKCTWIDLVFHLGATDLNHLGVTDVPVLQAVTHLGATDLFHSVPPTADGYIYPAGPYVENFFKRLVPAPHCCRRPGLRTSPSSPARPRRRIPSPSTEISPAVAAVEDLHQVRVRFDPLVLLISDSMHEWIRHDSCHGLKLPIHCKYP